MATKKKKTTGTKPSTKTGSKTGVKAGTKTGTKTGVKAGTKTGTKTGTGGRKTAPKKVEPADAARKTALAVASAALDNKAANVEIIDVRGKVDYADYVVIMSGRSDRHVSALARNIEDALRAVGQRCLGIEGLPKASWLLLDFGDVIVHVFHHDMRGYYDLERLWIDAARVAVEGA